MPRHNRRGRGGRALQRVAARTGRELTPYPMTFVPSSDPPSVRVNPIVKICLDMELENPTEGIYNISVGSIRNRLVGHSGIAKPNFIIERVAAWGAPGQNFPISITDYATGVQMYDEGDFVRRARVGIEYPRNVQRIYDQAATGTVNSVIYLPDSTVAPAFRAWLRYWDSEPVATLLHRQQMRLRVPSRVPTPGSFADISLSELRLDSTPV